MNSRIQQLIKECTYTVTDYSLGIDSSVEEFDKEKFAELIVRECQNRVEQYICDCGEIGTMPEHVMMKHFGIEE